LLEKDGFVLVRINIPVSGTLSRANVMFLQLIRWEDINGSLAFAFGNSVGLDVMDFGDDFSSN